ncbi:hypothetical protein LXL04_014828 [Taraxacum kok-saghyz]
MLMRSTDAMKDEQNRPDVSQADNAHMDKENQEHVGVEFRSPAQLKFALTNYAVRGGYQIYFEKSDRNRVINENVEEREELLVQGGRKCKSPKVRTRKASERINCIKLSKIVLDADGGGSSKDPA